MALSPLGFANGEQDKKGLAATPAPSGLSPLGFAAPDPSETKVTNPTLGTYIKAPFMALERGREAALHGFFEHRNPVNDADPMYKPENYDTGFTGLNRGIDFAGQFAGNLTKDLGEIALVDAVGGAVLRPATKAVGKIPGVGPATEKLLLGAMEKFGVKPVVMALKVGGGAAKGAARGVAKTGVDALLGEKVSGKDAVRNAAGFAVGSGVGPVLDEVLEGLNPATVLTGKVLGSSIADMAADIPFALMYHENIRDWALNQAPNILANSLFELSPYVTNPAERARLKGLYDEAQARGLAKINVKGQASTAPGVKPAPASADLFQNTAAKAPVEPEPVLLKVGMKVRPADRDNLGNVTGIDPETGRVSVHFYNSADNTHADVNFNVDELHDLKGQAFTLAPKPKPAAVVPGGEEPFSRQRLRQGSKVRIDRQDVRDQGFGFGEITGFNPDGTVKVRVTDNSGDTPTTSEIALGLDDFTDERGFKFDPNKAVTTEPPAKKGKQPTGNPTPALLRWTGRGKNGGVRLQFDNEDLVMLWEYEGHSEKFRRQDPRAKYDLKGLEWLRNTIINRLGLPADANVMELSHQYREVLRERVKPADSGATVKAPVPPWIAAYGAPETTAEVAATTTEPGTVFQNNEVRVVEDTTPPESVVETPEGVGESPIQFAAEGRRSKVRTPAGRKVDTHFALVEQGDLNASHDTGLRENPDYPEVLQPRDRTKMASEAQVRTIANTLDPELLGDNPLAGHGAPIVDKDGNVEVGNGRVVSLRRVYESLPQTAERYKGWLMENADTFGLTPEQVQAMQNPILVRVRDTEVPDLAKWVDEANGRENAEQSTAERARADIRLVTPEMLSRLSITEDGQFSEGQNADFINDFLKLVPPTERASLLTEKGGLSKAGIARISNAIFAAAYGGDTSALEKLAERTQDSSANVTKALMQTATKFAQQRALMGTGERHESLDFSGDISEAAATFEFLRSHDVPVDEYLSQTSLIAEYDNPVAKRLVEFFDKNAKSPKKIAAMLDSLYRGVEDAGNPMQSSLFGGGSDTPPTKEALLDTALRMGEEGAGEFTHPAESATSKTEVDQAKMDVAAEARVFDTPENTKAVMDAQEAAATNPIESPSLVEAANEVDPNWQEKELAERLEQRRKGGEGGFVRLPGWPSKQELDPRVEAHRRAEDLGAVGMLLDSPHEIAKLDDTGNTALIQRLGEWLVDEQAGRAHEELGVLRAIFRATKGYTDQLAGYLEGKVDPATLPQHVAIGFGKVKALLDGKIREVAYSDMLRNVKNVQDLRTFFKVMRGDVARADVDPGDLAFLEALERKYVHDKLDDPDFEDSVLAVLRGDVSFDDAFAQAKARDAALQAAGQQSNIAGAFEQQLKKVVPYLKDYSPHTAFGEWRIEIGGTFYSARESYDEAMKAANQLAQQGHKDVKIIQGFSFPNVSGAELPRQTFFKLINNLANDLGVDPNDIMTASDGTVRVDRSDKKFEGHLKKRTGSLTDYSDDIERVLKAYFVGMNKKVHGDVFRHQAQQYLDAMPVDVMHSGKPRLKEYFERYIGAVQGRPEWGERAIEESAQKLFHRLGIDPGPFLVRRMVRGVNKLVAFKALGFNVSSAVVNSGTIFFNVYPELGERYFFHGARMLGTKAGQKILADMGEFINAPGRQAMGYDIGSNEAGPLGMYFMFNKVEHVGRGVAALGAFRRAIDQGMSYKDALEAGIAVARDTMFRNDVSDMPEVLRNPVGRVIGQFKQFMFKEMKTMYNYSARAAKGDVGPLIRMIVAGTMFGGLRALFGVKQANEIYKKFDPDKQGFLEKLEQPDAEGNVPWYGTLLNRGLPGLAGVDVSRRTGLGADMTFSVSGPLDLMGAGPKQIYDVAEATKRYANMPSFENRQMLWRVIMPNVARYMYDAAWAYSHEGEVIGWNDRQRQVYQATPSELAIKFSGFTPLREEKLYEALTEAKGDAQQYQDNKSQLVDWIAGAYDRGDVEQAQKALELAAQRGIVISAPELRQEIIRKKYPALLRQYLSSPAPTRSDQMDALGQLLTGE